MKTILLAVLLAALAMLSGCATESQHSPAQSTNPHVFAVFKRPIPKHITISWPPPIFHSEPDSVVQPRLTQMQAFIGQSLREKGYQTFTLAESPPKPRALAHIDYTTTPHEGGGWKHEVEISFRDLDHTYFGVTRAEWRGYRSESIDTILATLSIAAVEKVPAYRP